MSVFLIEKKILSSRDFLFSLKCSSSKHEGERWRVYPDCAAGGRGKNKQLSKLCFSLVVFFPLAVIVLVLSKH